MALRAMYKGIKKVLAPLIINRPGELAIDQDALNTELDKTFYPRSEQAVSGQTNFFDISKVVNGNLKVEDNTVENSVTDTRAANFWVGIRKGATPVQTLLTSQNLPSAGHYEFSFTIPANADYDNLYIGHNGASADAKCSYPFNRFGTWYISFDATGVDISTVGGYVLTNIELALSADAPYAPYAMTNKELTEKVDNIKYTSNGTSYTVLKQYVVKPTITFSSGVGTATLYAPEGETIGSFAIACANSDKGVAYINVSGTTATITLTDTSYSSTAPVTIIYFTYKA